MANPAVYTWFLAYKSAVLETDAAEIPNRIHEALKAIENRVSGPSKLDDTEQKAIVAARAGLNSLKAESRDGSV
jgi:hypothetical protein